MDLMDTWNAMDRLEREALAPSDHLPTPQQQQLLPAPRQDIVAVAATAHAPVAVAGAPTAHAPVASKALPQRPAPQIPWHHQRPDLKAAKEDSGTKHELQDDQDQDTAILIGGIQDYYKQHKIPLIVCPPFSDSRWRYGIGCVAVWLCPMFLAGFGFLLQNFQLRIGTYYYVHTMIQQDLQLTPYNYSSQLPNANYIPLTIGRTPQNVSYGSLQDTVTETLGEYRSVNLMWLDMLAAVFPFGFVVLTFAMDHPNIWTRIMICFFILAVGKGLFAWITVEPDSNGWQVCKERLAGSKYSVAWYAEDRSVLDLLFMDPRSRLCADMMWSGHTYFVTLFAFGLHECVRLAFRASSAWKRILAESLVAFLVVFQQSVEIYFVLKSRFHYSADVFMSVFVTYLLYTNSTISVLTNRWITPSRGSEFLRAKAEFGRDFLSPKWMQTMHTRGIINLGCCCCESSQQYIYSREDIIKIMKVVQSATCRLHESERFEDRVSQVKMTPRIIDDVTESMGMLHRRSILCDASEENDEEVYKSARELSDLPHHVA